MLIEAFIGAEVSQLHRQRLAADRRHYEFLIESKRQTGNVLLRRKAGDALIRFGCRLAGVDTDACTANLDIIKSRHTRLA